MKRNLLIVFVILFLIGAVGIALTRKQQSDLFTDLNSFSTADKTFYYDPSTLLKSMPAGAASGVSAKDLQPMMIHYMKVKNIPFADISRMVHHRLTEQGGWTFTPTPGGALPAGMQFNMIQANQGSSPATPLSTAEPDHSLMVMPDFSDFKPVYKPGKPLSMPPVKSYDVIDMRRLASWEVAWLRVKNIGHNPFSSQQDLTTLMTN